MAKATDEALLGRTVAGKFLIESFLGKGAMGAVYKARQIALEKTVALKVMHADLASDPAFGARFQREAKAASRIDHPNSVRVIDFGIEEDGLLYIAMEFLAGQDLLTVMRESWPFPGARIVDIVMQMLSALTAAHGLGVVHRDLKPENIMVLRDVDEDGNAVDVVKVCDFGIAKLTNDPRAATLAGGAMSGGAAVSAPATKGPLTTNGTLIGTPEYMSPEQGRGDALDARSDLYSVGVILYQLLTGRVPFEAESAIGVILKHITDDPPRPTSLNAEVDPRLEAICLKAMRKKREDRYATARDMRSDLRAVREQARGAIRTNDSRSNAMGHADDSRTNEMGPRIVVKPESFVAIDSSTRSSDRPATVALAPSPATSGQSSGRASDSSGTDRPEFRSLPSVGTPAGTEIAIERSVVKSRRGSTAVIALMALLGGIAVGVTLLKTVDRKVVKQETPLPRIAATSTIEAPMTELTPLVPTPHDPQANGAASLPSPTRIGPTSPSARGKTAPPIASNVAHPAGSASSVPAPIASVVPPPAPVVSAPPAQPPPIAEGPAIDPERAYVEVGLVTPNNVKGDAVRNAVRQAPLSKCYQNALRARARRATGTATLSVSIDETGRISGAILTGADWLPEVTRCVQGATMGLQLRPGAVESGGGTADVWLAFRMP